MRDDAFLLLGFPPHPWIDPAEVTTRYHELARDWHPDAPSGDANRFAALNAARRTLSDPAQRLRLLALRNGGAAEEKSASAPGWMSETAFALGPLLRQATTLVNPPAPTSRLEDAVRKATIRSLAATLRTARENHAAILLGLEQKTRALSASADPSELIALADQWTFAKRWDAQLIAAIQKCEDAESM